MDNETLMLLNAYNLTSLMTGGHGSGDKQKLYQFAGNRFEKFSEFYDLIHKPLSLLICIFGISANFINLIVLTRRTMICVSNIILTGLSCAQLLLLLNYLLLLLYNHAIETCSFPSMLTSYAWTIFKWVNVNLNVSFHSTALFHTLFLTACRFMAVRSPHHAKLWLTCRNARRSALVLHLLTPLLCCPTFLTTSVRRIALSKRQRYCGLRDYYYTLDYIASPAFFQGTFWLYGVAFKLVPSVAILALSYYLIRSLKIYHNRSALLTGRTGHSGGTGRNGGMLRSKTTKIIVAVALLCVTVEFPHGVLNLLNALFGPAFGREVYDNLGDFFEMLTLFYSSVNFVLYSLMNGGYQRTVRRLLRRVLSKTCCQRRFADNNIDRRLANNNMEPVYLDMTTTAAAGHATSIKTTVNSDTQLLEKCPHL